MQCEVLLFAHLRQAIGCDRLLIDVPEGASAGDAMRLLAEQYPPIGAMQQTLAMAVNQKYVVPDSKLPHGCQIALIPPVSGG